MEVFRDWLFLEIISCFSLATPAINRWFPNVAIFWSLKGSTMKRTEVLLFFCFLGKNGGTSKGNFSYNQLLSFIGSQVIEKNENGTLKKA